MVKIWTLRYPGRGLRRQQPEEKSQGRVHDPCPLERDRERTFVKVAASSMLRPLISYIESMDCPPGPKICGRYCEVAVNGISTVVVKVLKL